MSPVGPADEDVRRPRRYLPPIPRLGPAPTVWTGLGAVGAAAAGAFSRSVSLRRGPDRWENEDLGELSAHRRSTVTAADGVPLLVREVGPKDAPLTVVFVHGFCLTMHTWHFQRQALAAKFGDEIRLVFYDQRGHGQSGPSPDNATITQLGADLESILASVAPTGPVVVVGHSMGGMTILAHARAHPEEYGPRIVGVGLVATAAKDLTIEGIAGVLESRAVAGFSGAAGRSPKAFEQGRKALATVLRPVIAGGSFGDPGHVSRAVDRHVDRMISGTSVATMVSFSKALSVHDESAGLLPLRKVPVVVVCGDNDLLTPLARSEQIAAELPKALLYVVPRTGHMVMLEDPETVDRALVELVGTVIRRQRRKRARAEKS